MWLRGWGLGVGVRVGGMACGHFLTPVIIDPRFMHMVVPELGGGYWGAEVLELGATPGGEGS